MKNIKHDLMGDETPKNKKFSKKNLLSTGSTLLNLACSGNWRGGFPKGQYVFIVGDSTSGKTFLSLTCLAEASISKHFRDYRFIFDEAEDGALMDIESFFGPGVADSMEAPSTDGDGNPIHSETIEEFYYHVDDAVQVGTPFIYVMDSMDALSSKKSKKEFKKAKKAHRSNKEEPGSYGDGKAIKNSSRMRELVSSLKATGSILILIGQSRDNLDFGPSKKGRSGGRALKFYATLEMWSSVRKTIIKKVRGKNRQIGIICKIQFEKNRITGQKHTIEIPIYHSFGFDNTGSCVFYLIEENHWKKKGNSIIAEEFDFTGTMEKLIEHIEKNNLEKKLQKLVGKIWDDIQKACAVKRKKRYE